MGRSPIFAAAMTLQKFIVYCKSVESVKSKCVCSLNQGEMTVFFQTIPDIQLNVFSTEGRFLVSNPGNHRHEKVDVKRVATEIQENDETLPKTCFLEPLHPLWRPCMRFVDVSFFRHLYPKCNYCTYFTSDIGAFLEYRCPHCRRDNWPSPGLYIAQTRWPEQQPMHSVWYRSAPTSYMVTDDLESYPLSHHEMCHTSDFLSKRRKFGKTDEDEGVCVDLSKDKVLKELGKWEEDLI